MAWMIGKPSDFPSWITVSPESGNGSANIIITIAPNLNDQSRSYPLLFLASNGDKGQVTVNQSGNIAVTGVVVTPNAVSLAVGTTQQLTFSLQPVDATDKRVTWSSSDSGVATVDGDGLVTAVTPGIATVTITTVDGSKTDQCMVTVKTPATFTPLTWATVQSVVDGMDHADILDMSELSSIPDHPVPNSSAIIAINKSITVTALLDPLGFSSGTLTLPFQDVAFVLSDNPTVTFDKIGSFRSPSGPAQPIISGTGNVVIKESSFNGTGTDMTTPPPIIDISGDLWMYGTIAEDIGGNIIHTSSIVGMTVDAPGSTKGGTAIHARNVTMEGGYIDGGYSYVSGAPAGNGIEASGNVTIKGHNIQGLLLGDPLMPFETTLIFGGSASDGDGGHAIVAAGTVTINGGGVMGGNGSGTNSKGGDGLIAGGDVYLEGERYDYYSDGGMSFTCYIRSGVGDYITGVPFRFSGSATTPSRTLTANTAMICGVNAIQYTAYCCMELQPNDRALLNDCRIGWYTNIPLFSGGWYKITNPFATWGTFDNATELL